MAQTTFASPAYATSHGAPRRGPERITLWIAAIAGAAFLAGLTYVNWDRILRGRIDFAQLYAGAILVGSDKLYSVEANDALIQEWTGATMVGVTYSRLPFYAFLLKPLTFLPYLTAYATFFALNFAAALFFIVRFSHISPELPVFALLSIPLAAALVLGQDTPILLLLVSASFLLARERRDFASGLVLSLCAIKFHLFLLFPIIVMARKRWRILQGGALGGLLLTLLSFAVGGSNWLAGYWRLTTSGYLNPAQDVMPNLKSLVLFEPALELPLAGLIAAGFVVLARKVHDFELLFSLALVAGLLVSFHAYSQDTVLLLLAFAIVASRSSSKPLRGAIALAISPVACLLLLAGAPYSASVPLLYLAVLCFAYFSRQNNSASECLT